MASRRLLRGLDWLFFFVADLQTSFGPFIAVYLTDHRWTQAQLGVALGVGSATAMLAQVPAGLLVDALRSKALAAAVALVGICGSAVLLAQSPHVLAGAAGAVAVRVCQLHAGPVAGGADARLGQPAADPGAARPQRAVRRGRQRGRRGHDGGVRHLGLDARGVLARRPAVPAGAGGAALARAAGGRAADRELEPTEHLLAASHETMRHVLLDRRLLGLYRMRVAVQLANAAMLPLAGVEITKRADEHASLIIAACILVPQLLVAALSPLAGSAAQRWGRRAVLVVGFCALPARALLLATVTDPYWIVPVQALDGLGGAAFGVMTPLIAADMSGTGGRFNLRMGILGLAVGVAATVSNTVGGAIASDLGAQTAFLALALAGFGAVLTAAFAMPETRPAAAPVRVDG